MNNQQDTATQEINIDTLMDLSIFYYEIPFKDRITKTLPEIIDDFLIKNKSRVNMAKKDWTPFEWEENNYSGKTSNK